MFAAGCAVAKAIALKGAFADDYIRGFTLPATWVAVEHFVSIIVIISIPALIPLFRGILGSSCVETGIKEIKVPTEQSTATGAWCRIVR